MKVRAAALLVFSVTLSPACRTPAPGAPYSVEASSPGVQAAVAHVLAENGLTSEGVRISNATEQIVSGATYSFRLQLEDRTRYRAKVYRDLDGQMKTTEFEEL